MVFNPDTEVFAGIHSEPIALTVSEASRLGAGDLVGSLSVPAHMNQIARAGDFSEYHRSVRVARDQRVNILAHGRSDAWNVAGRGLPGRVRDFVSPQIGGCRLATPAAGPQSGKSKAGCGTPGRRPGAAGGGPAGDLRGGGRIDRRYAESRFRGFDCGRSGRDSRPRPHFRSRTGPP